MHNEKNKCDFILGDMLPAGKFLVHSRFDNVINFTNTCNEIVFVTNIFENIASNGIYIKNAALSKDNSLSISKDQITINGEKISTNKTTTYNSKLTFSDIDHLAFEKKLIEIPENHNSLFPPESMLFVILPERCRYFTKGFDHHFMKNSLEAAEHLSSERIEKGIKLLKGTGKGLTPSGDDFIAGLLFGLHFNEFKSQKCLASLRKNIFRAAIGHNQLANTFLSNANRGNYFYLLKNFVILSSKKEKPAVGLNQLLSLGATSGADLLTGYIFCIKNKIGI